MWVLKLGGSLYHGAELPRWVNAIASSDDPPVVVPGGGPFADHVRDAQRRWGISDKHAHAMALLAMEQMGRLLCGLHPRLVACGDVASIRAALACGQVAVWMPSRAVLAQPSITADWTVTSDSLSLCLGDDLGARSVVLIKSAELPDGPVSVGAMQRRGIVDAAFERFAQRLDGMIMLVHCGYDGSLSQLSGGGAGCRLMVGRRSFTSSFAF